MAGRKITIEFLGDSKDLENATDAAGRSTTTLGDRLKHVGKVAALALAAGAVLAGKALFDMTKMAMEDEAAAAKLSDALKNNAGATDAQVASTEKWISAQGKALGVTDDELRPALARLVTATHDVGEAQKLASLAMDVSAGSGKSLESVSTALMKAQNGQVSALSRLGINTKNAAGETISMEQAVKRMGDTFGGAAATQAETLQGKMGRLKLMFDETRETIGAKMIPIVTRLADWFMAEGLPAISTFGNYIQTTMIPAIAAFVESVKPLAMQLGGIAWDVLVASLTTLGSVLTNQVAPAFAAVTGFLSEHTTLVESAVVAVGAMLAVWKTYQLVMSVVKAAVVAFTAVQAVLNAVMSANPIGIVILALVALAAGLVYAYKKSETFREIVDKAFRGIKEAWDQVGPPLIAAFKTVFNTMSTVLKTALDYVMDVFHMWSAIFRGDWGEAWNSLKSILSTALGAWRSVMSAGLDVLAKLADLAWEGIKAGVKFAWEAMKNIISTQVDLAIKIVRAIPGKVTDALGKLGTLLLDAGRDLIQGLIDGIGDKIQDLKNKLSEITDMIPDLKGPPAKDAVLLRPAGQMIMDGLISGIESRRTKLAETLTKVGDDIKKKTGEHVRKLKELRDTFAEGFSGFTSSVFGAEVVDGGASGNLNGPVQQLLEFQAKQRRTAEQLKRDIAKLTAMGLSNDLIKQMQAQGASGIANIHALATEGDAGNIATLNADNAATNAALGDAGMIAANEVYGDAIRDAKDARDDKLAAAVGKAVADAMDQRDRNTVFNFRLGARDIQVSLLELKRNTGNALLGLA